MTEKTIAEKIHKGERSLVKVGVCPFTITGLKNTENYTVLSPSDGLALTSDPGCMNKLTARKILFYMKLYET